MIRMIQSNSDKHAKAYFSDALTQSDYYLDDQELAGRFDGLLKDRLQLGELATKDAFFALCENLNPQTGQQLTARTKDTRTVGYDINFHCPKSVSVLHALSKDSHLLDAFQNSVRETMKDIEADSKARIRKGGISDDRSTGKLIWAEFTHQTARPVDEAMPDPHLHSHNYVFNVTWDDIEKQFKAGQFRDIKRDMPYYQAMFHKRLADRLIDLGYDIERTANSFEVKGVPKRIIELFSKRTDEIGRIAKEKGISNAKELDALGARTRSKKQKGHNMTELKEHWRKQIRELGRIEEEGQTSIRFSKEREQDLITSRNCVEYAVKHAFERASVIPERRLLEKAYRQALGKSSISIKDITDTLKSDNRIIHVKEKGRTTCTTCEVLAEEKAMVNLVREGIGKMRPLYKTAPDIELKEKAAEAIKHILTTSDRVSIVRGAAGTGKTTLLKEAKEQIDIAKKEIFVLAPTAEASRDVLRNEGFNEADTVARFLLDKKMQERIQDQVLWIDEAGLLGTQDMRKLLEISKDRNARLILGGDTRQHSSVVRGDALRIISTVAGVRSAEITKIYRQNNREYKQAVYHLSRGEVKKAFEKLDTIGSIKSIEVDAPHRQLIADYMKARKNGKSALIVSPTHKQGDEVTATLRHEMRAAGLLGKKEITVSKLVNLNLTEAEKTDCRNFHVGQSVQFNQNGKGIKRGSVWDIENIEKNVVTIQDKQGNKTQLPLSKAHSYDVFTKSEIQLSKGGKVMVTRIAFDRDDKRMNSGNTFEVVGVNKEGDIELRNTTSKSQYKVSKDFGHLKHAYCVTSHASQGKTVDEVFISQPASTFGATDAKQFYVSVSRARDAVHVYTDDKEGLLENASELGERKSAIELVDSKKKQNAHLRQLEISREQSLEQMRREKEMVIKQSEKQHQYEL